MEVLFALLPFLLFGNMLLNDSDGAATAADEPEPTAPEEDLPAQFYRIDMNLDTDPVTEINGFRDGNDTLGALFLETASETGGDLRFEDWDDGSGTDLYYGDTHVAAIEGGQMLELSDLTAEDNFVQIRPTADIFTDGDMGTNIIALGGDQTINGGGGDDYLHSFLGEDDTGADHLIGGAGDDVLHTVGPHAPIISGDNTYTPPPNTPTLEGGEGNDVLIARNAAIMTGGTGADYFAMDYPQKDGAPHESDPVQITDFEAGTDMLVISPNILHELDVTDPATEISVVDWPEGGGADLIVAGRVIAEITSDGPLAGTPVEISHILSRFLGFH